MNPKVDFFFEKAGKWQEEVSLLRSIVLDCDLSGAGLTEELKWGCPSYTLDKHNVVLIHTFKEYCAFLFFKGALLPDPEHILIQQTENVQAARQIRFTDLEQIVSQTDVLKQYIINAIGIEKSGQKVELKKVTEFVIADEFQQVLDSSEDIKTAFYHLTPGRQRAYLLHFSTPKQAKTRAARVEKYVPKILEGKGLDD